MFYTSPTVGAPVGKQGLIAAGTTQRPLFTGASNTSNLLLAGSTPAASVAHSYSDGIYHDWYLPSQDELNLLNIQFNSNANLFTGCQGTSPLTGDSYWSSSQYVADNTTAYFVNFANGVSSVEPMTNVHFVRAIRAF